MASQTEPESTPTVLVNDSLGDGEPNDAELTISLNQPENVESGVGEPGQPSEKTSDHETLVMTCEEGGPVSLSTDLVSSDQVILIQGDEAIMETGTAELQDLHIIIEVNGQQILLRNVVNGQTVLQELQIEEGEADKPADTGVKEVKDTKAAASGTHGSEDTPTAPVLFQVRAEDGSFHNVNMDIERQQPTPSTDQEEADISKVDGSTPGATSEERPFQCDLCSATFARLGNYTRHRMIHTIHMKEDYRYKCEVCGRMFLQRCDLKRHALIHEGNLPYKCDHCGKGYVRKSDLVVHVRFHNNERSFPCTQCSKAFFQSGDLQRHIRQVHQRIKPLTCGHCQRKYSKEATLIRHMQTVHRDIILTSLSTKVQPMDESEKEGQEVATTPPGSSSQIATT